MTPTTSAQLSTGKADGDGAVAVAPERFSDTVEFDELEQPIRSWPVVVDVTTTYVIWQEGEDYQDAIDTAKRDGELYEYFTPERVNGSDWAVVDKPYPWQWEQDYPEIVGPKTCCAHCGRVAFTIGYQDHETTCREYMHRASIVTGWRPEDKGKSRGNCNCSVARDDSVFPWRESRDEALADVALHVEGKRSEVRP